MEGTSLVFIGNGNSIVIAETRLQVFMRNNNLLASDKDTVVYILTEYNTRLFQISKLLKEGLTLGDVTEVFQARIQIYSNIARMPSLKWIRKFVEAFCTAGYDADVISNQIEEVARAYDSKNQFYIDQIIRRVINAKEYIAAHDPVDIATILAERESH